MKIVQAVEKLNSISRAWLIFGDGRFVYNFVWTLNKRATSVEHLTNFSFEFFMNISQ